MTVWLTQELARVQSLILLGAVVLCIFVVAQTFHRTRGVIPTLGALVLSGVVLWGMNNISWFQDKIKTETGLQAPAAVPAAPSGTPPTANALTVQVNRRVLLVRWS